MTGPGIAILAIVILFVVLLILGLVFASRYRKVGPNQVLVISGRKSQYVDPSSGQKSRRSYRIVRGGGAFKLLAAGLITGGLIGLILGSVLFDIAGAVAVALTFGLVAWIGFTILLAYRRGFDPAARYDPLVPRESIAAIEGSKTFLLKQWERQRRKVMGR